ncbi:SET and MYND domain-containing protein 4 isoform X2 [Eurytemora carolleeae]|uniref:SET and MYND domain-containing protein 4 isoform X2 n=1 Tax=Eurytemora carolleeae TaxID=1294199 RepID=UPI000C793EB0|nr:SET and MYND domain-containing protein 4 isoform X2 [Eurytemora carolleeae]|eukprot:XP_023326753.1 SET and MYND domain-containing protein 4-like isoform X2 [Eurytemora affinis]
MLCLLYGYPEENRFKIHQRLAGVYENMKDWKNAILSLQNLLSSIQTSNLTPDLRIKMRKEIQTKITYLQSLPDTQPKPYSFSGYELDTRHPEFSSLCGSVRVEKVEGKGRCAISRTRLAPGTLVAQEEAAASVLYIPKINTHCWICQNYTMVPYPCTDCPAIYCSLACFNKPRNRFECQLVCSGILDVVGVKECQLASNLQLAFSLITGVSPDQHAGVLAGLLKEPGDEPVHNQVQEDGKPVHIQVQEDDKLVHNQVHEDVQKRAHEREVLNKIEETELVISTGPKELKETYNKIHNLQEHIDSMNQEDLLSSGLTLLHWILVSGYSEESVISSDYLHLCIQYLGIIIPNCHATFQLESSNTDASSMSMVGLALFPDVASTFNHSCDPNTFVVDVGQEQLTITSRCIEEGEEITQVYYGYYADTDKGERQEKLEKKYNFICTCLACQFDYPTSAELLSETTFLNTSPEKLKSPLTVEQLTLLDNQNSRFRDQISECLQNKNLKQALAITKDRLKLISDNIRSPHALLVVGMISLVRYAWILFGRKSKAFKPKLELFF